MAIAEIISYMEQLNSLHDQLKVLAEQKKDVLILGQVDELMKIVNQESKMIKQVSFVEQQWIDEAALFLKEKGFHPGPNFSMSELIKMVTSMEEKQALQDLQARLLHTIDQLKELNAHNQKLIEQSLSYVNYSMDLLTAMPDDSMIYQKPTGTKSDHTGDRRRFFDSRA